MLQELTRWFVPISVPGILMIVWVVVMISVPVVRWTLGAGAEHVGIAAGVVAQVATVIAFTASVFGAQVLIIIALVPFFGWLSEAVGSRTGIPFGKYHYTEVLQPQVAHVPVLIPLAWLMMMPPAWAIGAAVAPNSPLLQWIVAAGAFTAWDFYLDPLMVGWDFWRWERKGAYLGIPVVNYLGWFAVALLITAMIHAIGLILGVRLVADVPVEPLVAIYGVTWLLQFVGQMFFWRLRASAAVGFFVMGAFVLLAVVAL